MQFSESWLRTLVNPAIGTEELAHQLTMAGLEVEETQSAAPAFSGVVVARIAEIAPHPDADKLRVCKVDDGGGELLQIVCGAPNAAAGLVVPLARVGAELPGGMKIGVAKMRGVTSSGMLCSARELGLSQDHGGLLELSGDLKPGTDIRQALDLDDTLFVLKLTPNRADCLSILGVAREVAALTGAPLSAPQARPVPVGIEDRLPVRVEAPDLCGRFAGRVIRGVNARAATPDWMKTRLERAGQRSVSALVDISNYVMLEVGRPSHVFDLDKIQGDLTVRWARKESAWSCSAARMSTWTKRSASSPPARLSKAWPASWAAKPRRSRWTPAISTWKPRSGGPAPSPAAPGATSSAPRPATASSVAWTMAASRSTWSLSPP